MSQAIEIIFRGNAAGAVAASRQAKSAIGAVGASQSLTQRALMRTAGAAAAVIKRTGQAAILFGATAAVAVAKTGIQFEALKEQSLVAFETMLGSGEKAQSMLDDLASFAAKTPFEFPELLEASQRLLAMGFQAQEIIPHMTAIGDAVAALGGGSVEIDRVVRALGQMQAKGKVSAEEMMQLTEIGIPAWEMLAKTLGVDVATAMEMVTKRQVDADKAIQGFMTQFERRWGGMMDKQSRTLAGLFSTTKDLFRNVSSKVMGPFIDDIKRGLERVNALMDNPAFQARAEAMGQRIRDALAAGFERLQSVWPQIEQGFASLAGWAARAAPAVRDVFLGLTDGARAAGGAIGVLGGPLRALWALFNSLVSALGGWRDAADTALRTLIALKAAQIAYNAAVRVQAIWDAARAVAAYATAAGGAAKAQVGLNTAMKLSPLGLIAGAIAGIVTWLGMQNTELEEAASNFERAGDAARGYMDAIRGAADAGDALDAAQLAVKTSRRELFAAGTDYTKAVEEFGRNSRQARDAHLRVEQASLAHRRALHAVQRATEDVSAAQEERSRKMDDFRSVLDAMLQTEFRSVDEVKDSLINLARGTDEFGDALRDSEGNVIRMAPHMREVALAAAMMADNVEDMPEIAEVETRLKNDKEFREKVLLLGEMVGALDGSYAEPRIDADTAGANRKLDETGDKVDKVGKKKGKPTVALGGADRLLSLLASIESMLTEITRPRTVTITTTYRNIRNALAGGGIIPGNPAAGDSVPALLTPGEMVLNEGQQRQLGGQAALARRFGFQAGGVVRRFASGGVAAGGAPTAGGAGGGVSGLLAELDRVARAIRDVGRAGDDASSRLGRAFAAMEARIKRLAPEGGKAAEQLQAALERVKAKVDRLKSAFQSAFEAFQGRALEAFDRLTGAHLTPAEQQLRDMQQAHDAQQRAREMADAQQALAQAVTDEERREARQRIADLMYEDQVRALEAQAQLERREYEDQRANQREHLERQLGQLQAALERGELTHKKYQARLRALLKRHGIDLRTAGALIGNQFVRGLGSSLKAVEKFADAIAGAVRRLIQASGGGSGGGASTPGHARGGVTRSPWVLVGEQGPELARLPVGTRITPAGQTRRLLDAMLQPAPSPAAAATAGAVYQRGGDTYLAVTVNVAGSVATERDIAQNVRKHLERITVNGGRLRFS